MMTTPHTHITKQAGCIDRKNTTLVIGVCKNRSEIKKETMNNLEIKKETMNNLERETKKNAKNEMKKDEGGGCDTSSSTVVNAFQTSKIRRRQRTAGVGGGEGGEEMSEWEADEEEETYGSDLDAPGTDTVCHDRRRVPGKKEGSKGGNNGNQNMGMKSNVPKTMVHPLSALSRREFKKVADKLQGGNTACTVQFRSIDDHVNKIMEAVSHIVDDTYETYGNAAKRIQMDGCSTGPSGKDMPPPIPTIDATIIANTLAEARRIKSAEENLRAQYVVLDVSHKRQKDLYCQLHACAQDVSDECAVSGNSSVAAQTLAAILKQGMPNRESRPTRSDEEVVDRISDQLADLRVVEVQYKMMLAEIDRLYGVIKEMKEKSISRPFSGPPVLGFPDMGGLSAPASKKQRM